MLDAHNEIREIW